MMIHQKSPLFIFCLFVLASVTSGKAAEKARWFGDDWRDHWIEVRSDTDNPVDTFSVENGVLRISGVPNGYLRTKESFSSYRLTLEWRWVDDPGNSGILLHINGPDQVWPLCIECQLHSGKAGDIVMIREGSGVRVNGEDYRVSPGGMFAVADRQVEGAERAPGEWNQYDIVCDGTNLSVTINGIMVNQGSRMTLSSGHIGIQSEGQPIEIRNFSVTPLAGQQ